MKRDIKLPTVAACLTACGNSREKNYRKIWCFA